MAENRSDLCNFYGNVISFCCCCFFLIFVLENTFFLLFFAEFELLMFRINIVKISEKNKNEQAELMKNCLQDTYHTDFCIICIPFYYGKKRK